MALHFDLKTYSPPIGDIQLPIVVVAYGGSSSGDISIGPKLATSSEIDHQIDTMLAPAGAGYNLPLGRCARH